MPYLADKIMEMFLNILHNNKGKVVGDTDEVSVEDLQKLLLG